MFERYVNFEFYKTTYRLTHSDILFERYVNFEFYKTHVESKLKAGGLRDM